MVFLVRIIRQLCTFAIWMFFLRTPIDANSGTKTLLPRKSDRKRAQSKRVRGLLMAQYAQYLATLDLLSQEREAANRAMFLAHAALMSATIIAITNIDDRGSRLFVEIALACGAFGLIALWLALLHSYDVLKEAKQQIVRDLERHLPAHLYRVESEMLGRTSYPQKNHLIARSVQTLLVVYGVLAGLWFWGAFAA